MIINKTNGGIINTREVYIHDDILKKFSFDREKKRLHLVLWDERKNKEISMEFQQVIAFEMTSCDFWGGFSYIFDFEYIETKMTFVSGDYLIVACKSIIM